MAAPQAFNDIADVINQGANGDDTYSNDRALYGFIEAYKFLRVPEDNIADIMPLPALTVADLGRLDALNNFLGENSATHRTNHPYPRMANQTSFRAHQLALLNFNYLRDGGMEIPAAFLVSALRARWVTLGCLATTTALRHVTINEVVVDPGTDGIGERIAACETYNDMAADQTLRFGEYHAQVTDARFGIKFVTLYAETIWAMSEYLFRVRGHHYKPEYDDIIRRMMKAASQGAVELPSNFPMAEVFHTSIHPFGISALAVMTFHFIAWGKISNALILRISGAPNGCAAITTASAAINSIAGEAWYPRFSELHTDQITKIHGYAQIVLNNKYGYHLAAGLYGVAPMRTVTIAGETKTLAQVDQEVSALAPALQAFINYSKEVSANDPNMSFSFQNAKVLEKRASANPLLIQRTQALINYTIDAINASKDVASAISSTFPDVRAAAPANPP